MSTKVLLVKAMVFPVVTYGCESWSIKLSAEELMLLTCGVGEDSWESSDCKEIQPVHPKGDQSWVFIGRTDFKAETPIFWPPDAKSWLIWKDPDAGKDWRQEEKGTAEDEMAGWHHRLNGHGFGWTLGVGDGQGGLTCWDSWDCRVGHEWVTEFTLSPSSRSSLVPLHFLPLEWYHLHIWGCYFWQSWFQLVLYPAWHFSWHTLHWS